MYYVILISKRIIKMTHKLRKPVYGEALVNYSVKLRKDQAEYLKRLRNASEWLRNIIDKEIAVESGGKACEDTITMSKRITALEREIKILWESLEYVRAREIMKRGLEIYERTKAELSKRYEVYDSGNTSYFPLTFNGSRKALEFAAEWTLMAEGEGIYCAGWSTESLLEFLEKNGVIGENISFECAVIIFERIISSYPSEVKICEKYHSLIGELEAQIAQLRHKIIEKP